MSYDGLKVHDGRTYSGMPVGGRHSWVYQPGVWDEVKRSPDEWSFDYSARKLRAVPSTPLSGPDLGTEYRWLVVGTQVVRKADKDSYETRLVGRKFKLGHRRPTWAGWSYDYPGSEPLGHRYERFMATASMRYVLAELENPPGVAA